MMGDNLVGKGALRLAITKFHSSHSRLFPKMFKLDALQELIDNLDEYRPLFKEMENDELLQYLEAQQE
jgi:hypothetical protein